MDFTQLSKKIIEKCPEVLNSAWKAAHALALSELSDVPAFTKFGGAEPFRSKNFRWPKCSECEKQKAFICQINIGKLPEKMKLHIKRNDGLFQCFFCLKCLPYDGCFDDIYFVPGDDFVPSLQSLASKSIFQNQLITKKLPAALKSFILNYNEVYQRWDWEGFEERQVEEWIELKREIPRFEEIRSSEEGEHIILAKTGVTEDELMDMEDEDVSWGQDEPDATQIQFPNSGIKLGGYVRWCQGVEYPKCPDCKVKMTVTFLQMEEDSLFPFSWGDAGTAHVTLCTECGRPGLGWACC